MRILIFLASFVLNYALAISQTIKVHNPNRSIRAGFENTIEFSLKRKFDSVDLRASQGSVIREGRIIRFTPAIPGEDTLFVKFYSRGKIVHLDTMTFEAIKPEVFPSLGGDLLRGRKVKLSYIKALGGIIFYIAVNDYHWEGAGVESYRFSIIRKDSCIFSKIEHSSRYSDELKSKLDLLIPGDKILISDATINSQFSKIANILPGVFEIE